MARPAYSVEQVDRIRGDIMEVALRVFRRSGTAGLTLRAIAVEMALTPAALYRYFASKDELLSAIRGEGFARMGEELAQAREDATGPADAARRGMRAYCTFALAEPQLFALMFQLDQGEGQTAPAERQRAFAHARAIGADAAAAGLVAGDGDVAAHLLWSAAHGLASLVLARQLDMGCSYEDLIDPLLERITGPFDTRRGEDT